MGVTLKKLQNRTYSGFLQALKKPKWPYIVDLTDNVFPRTSISSHLSLRLVKYNVIQFSIHKFLNTNKI